MPSDALSGATCSGLRQPLLVDQYVKYEAISVTDSTDLKYNPLKSSITLCFLLITMSRTTQQCIFGLNKLSNTDLAEAAHRIQKQLSNPEFRAVYNPHLNKYGLSLISLFHRIICVLREITVTLPLGINCAKICCTCYACNSLA